MAKGEDQFSLISAGEPPRPSTVLQIFQDAAKLVGRSWKLLLSIFLLLLLPYSLLFLGNYLTVTPLAMDMVTKFLTMRAKDPRSPEYRELLAAALQDLRGITGAEVATLAVSHLLTLLQVMATVYTVAMAAKGEQITLGDLLSRMRRTWKGPVTTSLYVSVMSFGYTALLFVMAGVFAFVSNGSGALLAVDAGAAFLAVLLLLYLQVVWNQGMVVSVVEEGRGGLAALGRASELIRGRRRLGFRVNLHLFLMTVFFFMAYGFVKGLLPPGEMTEVAGGIVMIYCSMVLSVFMLAVYVAFYYECRKGHGEEEAMEGSLGYTKVSSTAPVLDGALP